MHSWGQNNQGALAIAPTIPREQYTFPWYVATSVVVE